MKKILFSAAFSLMAVSAMADDVPGMIVSKTNGSKVNVILSDVRSIKFDSDNMLINKKDNSQQTIALGDVSLITFGDVSTAIKAIVGTSNQKMTITDLSGRIVYKGDSQSTDIPSSLHGIYIISVDGKSHKVSIK